jgi:RimJ/RimL family protein N-acetyltransferase
MLDHAFRFLDSVVFLVGPNNVRSQRALEQIGARREGEPDSQGRVVFRITASDHGRAPGKVPR